MDEEEKEVVGVSETLINNEKSGKKIRMRFKLVKDRYSTVELERIT